MLWTIIVILFILWLLGAFIVPFGGNDGQFPDAISDIKPGFIVWESGRIEGKQFLPLQSRAWKLIGCRTYIQ